MSGRPADRGNPCISGSFAALRKRPYGDADDALVHAGSDGSRFHADLPRQGRRIARAGPPVRIRGSLWSHIRHRGRARVGFCEARVVDGRSRRSRRTAFASRSRQAHASGTGREESRSAESGRTAVIASPLATTRALGRFAVAARRSRRSSCQAVTPHRTMRGNVLMGRMNVVASPRRHDGRLM